MTSPGSPEPAPPARPTSHRKRTPAADLLRRSGPPLLAVSSVAVVILLLLVLNSRPTPTGPAPGAVTEPTSVATSAPLSSPPLSAAPEPSTPAPATSSVAPPPVSEPPATQQPVAAKAPVTVLNNSRRQGLAAHVAAQVRAAGWPVRRTGNFTGRIAETTLYFGPGQRAVALRLAGTMHQIRRVLPRFHGLPGSGLTLVVTRDWPD